jgi:Flp pilus assembly protein TadD
LVTEPDDSALCHNHGLCLYFQCRWEEASHAFSRAELLGLKIADNFSYLTKALHQAGNTVSSLQACRKWVKAAKDEESATYLARLLEDAGNIEEARAVAMEILKENPRNGPANIILGFKCIEDTDVVAAASHFELASSQEPTNSLAWLGMGLTLLQQKNADGAKVMLEKAVDLAPKSVGVIVALGWAHIVLDDVKGAEVIFKRALSVDHSFGEAHGGMASALALVGKLDASQREITKARRLNSRGFGAEFAQAVVLAKEGNHAASNDWIASILQMPAADGMKPLIDQIRATGL